MGSLTLSFAGLSSGLFWLCFCCPLYFVTFCCCLVPAVHCWHLSLWFVVFWSFLEYPVVVCGVFRLSQVSVTLLNFTAVHFVTVPRINKCYRSTNKCYRSSGKCCQELTSYRSSGKCCQELTSCLSRQVLSVVCTSVVGREYQYCRSCGPGVVGRVDQCCWRSVLSTVLSVKLCLVIVKFEL